MKRILQEKQMTTVQLRYVLKPEGKEETFSAYVVAKGRINQLHRRNQVSVILPPTGKEKGCTPFSLLSSPAFYLLQTGGCTHAQKATIAYQNGATGILLFSDNVNVQLTPKALCGLKS